MRILLLTHLYLPTLGGVQRSVHTLACHLAARGHDVSIATHRPGRFGVSVTREDGLSVLGLNIPSPFTFWPLPAARRHALDALNAIALLGWCIRRRVEVVHCHLINVDTRYASLVSRVTGAKSIVTLRGGETEHWLDTLPARRAYVRRVLERADWVTAVSGSLLRQARDLVPDVARKSSVVPNPIDAEAIAAAAGPEPDREATPRPVEPYLLFVGRLEPMKDVGTLLDAYHTACADPSFTPALVVVGEGSLRTPLERQARNGGGRERISFVGRRAYRQTLGLIRDAELLVLPSRSSEGCPNVALEAMALGTPVIVSDLEALRELVDEGAAGAVFARGDAGALAEQLIALTTDPSRRERYVGAARARLAGRHRVESVLEAYERIYGSVAVTRRAFP